MSKRFAVYTNESFYDTFRGAFFLALVEENAPGYHPLAGRYPTVESAKQEAARLNELRKLTDDDVWDIVASSLRASIQRASIQLTPRKRAA